MSEASKWKVSGNYTILHQSGYSITKGYCEGCGVYLYTAWSPADEAKRQWCNERGCIIYTAGPADIKFESRQLGSGTKAEAMRMCSDDHLSGKKGTPEPSPVRVDKSRDRAS